MAKSPLTPSSGTEEGTFQTPHSDISNLLGTGRERVEFTIGSNSVSDLNTLGKDLLNFLNARVAGQERAKHAIARIASQVGKSVSLRKGPLGSVMFAGPSGTGKNTIVEGLAEFFLDDKTAFTRLDAGKISNSTSDTWTFFGSAPGYVDGEIEPQLGPENIFTPFFSAREELRLHESIANVKDFGIVMIDEADQLSEDLFKALYALTDEDEVSMNRGRCLTTKNLIIIFATNQGWEQWEKFLKELHTSNKSQYTSYADRNRKMKQITKTSIEEYFPTGLMSRIEVINFDFLQEEDVYNMIDIFFQEINAIGENYGIQLIPPPQVYGFYKGQLTEKHGARPIGRALQENIGGIINQFIGDQSNEKYFHLPHGGIRIELDVKDKKLISTMTVDQEVDRYVQDDFSVLIKKILEKSPEDILIILGYMYKEYLNSMGIDIADMDVLAGVQMTPSYEERPNFTSSISGLKRADPTLFSYLNHAPRLRHILGSEALEESLIQITENQNISSRVIQSVVYENLGSVKSSEHFDTFVERKKVQMKNEIFDRLITSDFTSITQAQFKQAILFIKGGIGQQKVFQRRKSR